jgi:hypothetical protein
LRVVLYGCETWYVILREGYRLREFENRALKKISGPMWDKVRVEWSTGNSIKWNFMTFTPHQILFG